jgi:hypothetical protein
VLDVNPEPPRLVLPSGERRREVDSTLGDSLEQVARGVEHAREDGVALTIRAPPPVAFVSNSQTQSPCSLASRFMMFACWLLK